MKNESNDLCVCHLEGGQIFAQTYCSPKLEWFWLSSVQQLKASDDSLKGEDKDRESWKHWECLYVNINNNFVRW